MALTFPVRSRVTTEQVAAPLGVLFLGYPVWWVLGIQEAMWFVIAGVLVVWLVRNRASLVVPRGYGIMAVFIGWVLISGLMLSGPRFALSYGLKLALYSSVLVIGFFVWNLLHHGFPVERVIRLVVWFWAFAVLLSFPALLFPGMAFESPVGGVLSSLGFNDPYIVALTRPHFSEFDVVYHVARPSPLFEYTNIWGGAIGVLTPVAVYAALQARTFRGRVLLGGLLAASAWPIIVSVNRGCWISIALAVAYVVGRRALSRDMKAVALAVVVAVACAVLVLLTPLDKVVTDRLQVANTDTRANLYSASIHLAAQSPIFGHGAPQSSADVVDNNNVSVGTHGQFWTILVSQGYVGVLLFVLGLLALWWYARPADGRSPEVWLHATGLVVLFQMFVYDVVPLPLTVLLISNAVIAARNRERHRVADVVPAARFEAQKGQSRVPLHA